MGKSIPRMIKVGGVRWNEGIGGCNMCTCASNCTQERAVQDLLCLVDLYLVYFICFQLGHCL